MKLISALIGFIVAVLAVCFALSNRQAATLSLWPFDVALSAPVYLISLGTLFFGLASGAAVSWLSMIPHRLRHRRLQREVANLNAKILDLQQSVLAPKFTEDGNEADALNKREARYPRRRGFSLPRFRGRFVKPE